MWPTAAPPPFDEPTDPSFVRLLQLLRDHGADRVGGARPAGGAARRAGQRPRRGPPPRAPPPGRQPGLGRQLRDQPPRPLGDRLEHLLRAPQPGRGGPPRRPGGGLRRPGLRHPRPLPPRRRDDRAGLRRPRARRGPQGGRARPRRACAGARRRATSATTSSIAAAPRWGRPSATAPPGTSAPWTGPWPIPGRPTSGRSSSCSPRSWPSWAGSGWRPGRARGSWPSCWRRSSCRRARSR